MDYIHKINEPVGEGKIIQEEKKNDGFDAEIYLEKLKGTSTKLMRAHLDLKDTFIERIPNESIVMSTIEKDVVILENTGQMHAYNQFSFSSRLKRLYAEYYDPENKLKDQHDSFHEYCLP